MKDVRPYLIFSGNCREALEHYAECLGGEISFLRTQRDSPLEVAEEHADRVFHSELVADGIRLLASDDLPGHEVDRGTNFALFVHLADAAELALVFERLSAEGQVLMPLKDDFAMLEDRFGIRWMLGLAEDAADDDPAGS